MKASVFVRYGGFVALRRVVSAFYDKLLDSPVVGHYFEAIDMATLIDHQTKFFASIMGGPASYSDEMLRRAHARLGINAAEFDEMTEILRETLEEFDYASDDIDAVCGELKRRESVIVTR